MADCDNEQECEKIVPTPIKPEPLPKQCSGGGESGEGTNDFNELDNRPKYNGQRMTGDTNIPKIDVVQTTGDSQTNVMSQKAITVIVGDIETALSTINNGGES